MYIDIIINFAKISKFSSSPISLHKKYKKTCLILDKFFSKNLARGQGFEPRLTGPKPAVLPLDDPRKYLITNH